MIYRVEGVSYAEPSHILTNALCSLYGVLEVGAFATELSSFLQIYKYGVNGSTVDFFHFARGSPNKKVISMKDLGPVVDK